MTNDEWPSFCFADTRVKRRHTASAQKYGCSGVPCGHLWDAKGFSAHVAQASSLAGSTQPGRLRHAANRLCPLSGVPPQVFFCEHLPFSVAHLAFGFGVVVVEPGQVQDAVDDVKRQFLARLQAPRFRLNFGAFG